MIRRVSSHSQCYEKRTYKHTKYLTQSKNFSLMFGVMKCGWRAGVVRAIIIALFKTEPATLNTAHYICTDVHANQKVRQQLRHVNG